MYPKLTLNFNTIDNTKDLIQHSIDLDIRIGNDIAPNMIAKRLASNFRILCASPSYLNKNGVPESVDDLRFHDFLSISERDQSSVLLKLQHHNEDMVTHIRPRFVSNNGEISINWPSMGMVLFYVQFGMWWRSLFQGNYNTFYLHTGKMRISGPFILHA